MTQQYPQYSPHPPQPPAKRANKWPWVTAIVASAVLAGGIGAGIGGAVALASQPEPEPVVTPEPVVRTEYLPGKTVTPPECIEALDLAVDVIGVMEQLRDEFVDAISAAYLNDDRELGESAERVQTLNDEMDTYVEPLGEATNACRESAE